MAPDDALLLIENAVTALNPQHQAESLLTEASELHLLFALQPDITARGIQPSSRLAELRCIDYDDFVQLTIQHHVTCYWK
ncbi:MAG: sulfurtransferase complex subunit TusB [Gammaproteobacteria bacterium]|nr:sulfurtransferase complex subunit TusB [Gammaproteobacteria bacterium]